MNILGAGRYNRPEIAENQSEAAERISGALHGWGQDVPEEYQLFPQEAASFTVDALQAEGVHPHVISDACNEVSGRVRDSHPRASRHLASLATQVLKPTNN